MYDDILYTVACDFFTLWPVNCDLRDSHRNSHHTHTINHTITLTVASRFIVIFHRQFVPSLTFCRGPNGSVRLVLWSNLGRAKEEGVKGLKGVEGVGRKRWHC